MRDKLIELTKMGAVIIPETAESVAEYLIANNVTLLPDKLKDSWELTEVAKIKQEFEYQKIKQILTDIRDYLVTEKGRVANSDIYLFQIQAVEKFADKALADLNEYAEKLGVEL